MNLPAYNEVPTTQFQFDFDFERKLLGLQTEEAGGPLHLGEDDAEPSNEEETKEDFVVVDPWDEHLQRYAQLGYSRQEVCMALAATGSGKDEQVIEFCQHYRKLKDMGYAPALIMGALTIHRGDLLAATSTCIDIS